MTLSLSEEKIKQLEAIGKKVQADLKQQHIIVVFKVLPDALYMTIDLNSLVDAIFYKYQGLYRNHQIIGNRYLLIEVK